MSANPIKQRESLELTPSQWRALEEMAAQEKTLAASGPKRGQPSWRVLISQLASGQFTLERKESTPQ